MKLVTIVVIMQSRKRGRRPFRFGRWGGGGFRYLRFGWYDWSFEIHGATTESNANLKEKAQVSWGDQTMWVCVYLAVQV